MSSVQRADRYAAGSRMAFLAVLAAAAPAVSAAGQATLTLVARSGDPLANGGTFANAGAARLSSAGHAVGIGTINSATVNAVVTGSAGAPFSKVIAAGDPAPGTPAGTIFGLATDAWPDSSGRVLVFADISGPTVTGTTNTGLWLWENGSLRLIIRRGDVPVTNSALPAGTTMSFIGSPSFVNGRVVFAATLEGGGTTASNDRSLWTYDGSNLTMLLREGDASVVVAGANWSGFGDPVINASGAIAFAATVNTGVTTNNSVIVTGPSPTGPFALVAREGAAAPGTGAGVMFSGDFSSTPSDTNSVFSINSAGEVLFLASLTGTGVTTANATGLWRRSGATTSLLTRNGDAAPGLPAPQPLLGSPASNHLGGAGGVGWRTVLSGTGVTITNDTAIVRRIGTTSPTTVIIQREGDAAPGEPANVTFGGTTGTSYSARAALNGVGQMLIEAQVIQPGVIGGRTGYWCNDPTTSGTSQLRKIIRGGDTVNLVGLSGITTATVSSIVAPIMGDTQSGRPTSINDAGRLLLSIGLNTSIGPINGLFSVSFAEPVLTGACCSGSTCAAVAQAACTGPNTRFAGAGTGCNAFSINNTTPCCLADFNQAGGVTVQDIFDFLLAYFSNAATANINGNGGVTVQDIFDFLGAYFAGCA